MNRHLDLTILLIWEYYQTILFLLQMIKAHVNLNCCLDNNTNQGRNKRKENNNCARKMRQDSV